MRTSLVMLLLFKIYHQNTKSSMESLNMALFKVSIMG